jgi:hypothetical protein
VILISPHSENGASRVVIALPNHSTMCVYFESSYRCQTPSRDIGRTWNSYSRFDLRGSPHTMDSPEDSPERAQRPETRCRELSCKGL